MDFTEPEATTAFRAGRWAAHREYSSKILSGRRLQIGPWSGATISTSRSEALSWSTTLAALGENGNRMLAYTLFAVK